MLDFIAFSEITSVRNFALRLRHQPKVRRRMLRATAAAERAWLVAFHHKREGQANGN
jgi:hypothetical protein